MKRLPVLFWTLSTALLSLPQLAAGAPAPLTPMREGYAFNHPRILLQQHLFGLAHGVSLLAADCARDARYRESVLPAYAEWNERQSSTIEAGEQELARHYFGDRAGEATRRDVARALKLRDKLSLKPGSKALREACETFVEVLRKPRYDLRHQYRLQFLAARLEAATVTEAEAEACDAHLASDEAAQIKSSLALWHGAYDSGLIEARSVLEKHWSELEQETDLETWLAQVRARASRAATSERCKTLAAKLLTTNADPDDAFKR